MGVFEEAAGANGEGVLHKSEEGGEVCVDSAGQFRGEKHTGDAFVGNVFGNEAAEVVMIEEFIEDVGSQGGRLGDEYADIVEPVAQVMATNEGVDEGQSAGFSTEGSSADAGEAAGHIELLRGEVRYDTCLGFFTKLGEGLNEVCSHFLNIGEVAYFCRSQPSSEFEFSSGHEPVAEVVVCCVELEGCCWNTVEPFLQFAEILCPADFMAFWQFEDEVPEAEVAENELTELAQKVSGVFMEEACIELGGGLRVAGVR